MKRRKFLHSTLTAGVGALVLPTIVPSSVFGKNAPSNKINIAHIGCGRIGRKHDMPFTIKHDLANVVAVCDVDKNRLTDAKKRVIDLYKKKTGQDNYVDPKMYTDYREVLLNKDIDAVVISTPDHWHAEIAAAAALAGKHVYVQKPTSLTVEEGRMLSNVVKKTNIILQVGTQQRSYSQFRVAAELVRNGRIGKLHTIKIGLTTDPAGPVGLVTAPPANLDYNKWLGSTPYMPYTEMAIHPQKGYERPGWMRIEQFGSGMITGWGQHHYDSASWGMDTELTGPISVQALAEFPKSGTWNVHGDFMAKAEYANGLTMYTSNIYPNGIRYEGSEGWIFVSRGNEKVTDSDPVPDDPNAKSLDASDPKILGSIIGENEIHLYKSEEQHLNWLECIKSGKQPISPIEIGHRACTICLITHIAMKVPGILKWDPVKERFLNSDTANKMLSRAQTSPYGINAIVNKY